MKWDYPLPDMERTRDPRVRQLAVGMGILLVLTVALPALLIGWRYLPGAFGEWVGMIVGILTTPFLLEGSFLIIGMLVVVTVIQWRRNREGDEFVYLEQVDEVNLPEGLPDQAKWAVYRENPLVGEEPSLLEKAEGAMSIGDYEMAGACLSEMAEEDLKRKDVLEFRIALARATGRMDLARHLETGMNQDAGA